MKKFCDYRKLKKKEMILKYLDKSTCSSCFRLFPSVFYLKNDAETIRKRGNECMMALKRLIMEYCEDDYVENV